MIKFLMAFLLGIFVERAEKLGKCRSYGGSAEEIFGMILAGAEMTAGYYLAEAVMYGSRNLLEHRTVRSGNGNRLYPGSGS